MGRSFPGFLRTANQAITFSNELPPTLMTGSLASTGYLGTWFRRFMTSIRARFISVSMANSNCMEPLPKLDVDDILSKPGTLRSTSSCGSIISDSISLGAEARQGVRIEISGRSISGVIWIGSRNILMVPKMTTNMHATITATGLPKDKRVKIKTFNLMDFWQLYLIYSSDKHTAIGELSIPCHTGTK